MDSFSPSEQMDTESTITNDPGFSADDYLSDHAEGEQAEDLFDARKLEGNSDGEHGQYNDPSTTKKKKKNPFQKRIDKLVYENGTQQQTNSFLAQQLAEKEAYIAQQQARLQEVESQLTQKDQYANEYFENSLQVQEHALKQKLREAKENGDVDLEIQAIDQLAEIKAARTTHEAWKIQEQARKQENLYNEPYEPYETHLQPQHYPQQPVNHDYQEWENDNPWVKNPGLHNEALALGQELSKIYAFNNQSHLIGTYDFYDQISQEMAKRYGVNSMQQSNQQQPEEYEQYEQPQPSRPTVAPVSRRTAVNSMAHGHAAQRGPAQHLGAALNKDQYNIARHLDLRPGQTEADLVKRYRQAMNYPKSPLDGGTPYRLTIL